MLLSVLVLSSTAGFVTSFLNVNFNSSKFALSGKYNPFDYSAIKHRKYKIIRSMKKNYRHRKAAEDFSTQFVIKKSRIYQYNFYGYKMSRAPGDGGAISNFRRGSDNRAIIASYYTGIINPNVNHLGNFNRKVYTYGTFNQAENQDNDVFSLRGIVNITREEIDIINNYPDNTFGKYQGSEPVKSEMPARECSLPPHANEYRFYATGKRPRASVLPRAKTRVSHRVIKDQGYVGLLTDVLFKDMDESNVNQVRQLEIKLKSRTIKQKEPEKKTYWRRTYTWDIPSEVASLINSDQDDSDNSISFNIDS